MTAAHSPQGPAGSNHSLTTGASTPKVQSERQPRRRFSLNFWSAARSKSKSSDNLFDVEENNGGRERPRLPGRTRKNPRRHSGAHSEVLASSTSRRTENNRAKSMPNTGEDVSKMSEAVNRIEPKSLIKTEVIGKSSALDSPGPENPKKELSHDQIAFDETDSDTKKLELASVEEDESRNIVSYEQVANNLGRELLEDFEHIFKEGSSLEGTSNGQNPGAKHVRSNEPNSANSQEAQSSAAVSQVTIEGQLGELNDLLTNLEEFM